MRAAVAVLLAVLLPVAAFADDVTALPGLLRQQLVLTVASADGATSSLEALVVRPDGPGPFPLALITHGMPRLPADFPLLRPQIYAAPAVGFAQRGYAAVIVMRRGYGRSAGPFAEALGPCDDRNYLKAGNAAAADVLAALASLRGEPWADPARVVLIGHSMGGFALLASSSANPAGVLGIISFAGAVGSPRPGTVCQPDRLIDAARDLGRTANVPSLWLFAENDGYFAPALARAMFDAYRANGAPASLFAAPPYGRDGHALIFASDEAAWWPPVAAFLGTLHLPTQVRVPLPPLPHLAEPAPLDEAGRAAFAAYVPSRTDEKAFATDAAGHYGMAWGQRTRSEAEQAALKDCARLQRVCAIYATGNELAPGRLSRAAPGN